MTEITHDVPVRFSVKVTKVDPETREVEGVATQEVLDAHNQVVDHESMKAVLRDWPGNIREMHQAKAVGRAVFAKTDDEARATIVRARVSKGAPDTWEKVQDGTLGSFSIGGLGRVVMEKDATGHDVGRIFMQKLTEISLVDNPACPTAHFEICKSVDGELVGVQPADVAFDTRTWGPVAKGLVSQAMLGSLVAIGKRAEPYDIQQSLQCIAFLESLLANEMFEAEYADIFGGDTDAATQKTEIAYLKAAGEFLLKFLISEFGAQFKADAEDTTVAMAKRREALTGALDTFEKALPATWGKLDGTGQFWIAKAGARHSKKDVEMIQNMHDTAVALGAKSNGAHDGEEESTEKAARTAAAAADKVQNVVDPPVAAPAVVDPPAVPVVAAPVEKVVITPAAEPAAAVVDIKKLIGEAVTTALEAQQAAHTGVVAGLEKRLKDLEDSPMPGGPKTRATGEPTGTPAEKRLASEPGAGAADIADPAQVDALLEKMISETTDDHQRMLLVERRIKHQREHGIGQVLFRRETAASPR